MSFGRGRRENHRDKKTPGWEGDGTSPVGEGQRHLLVLLASVAFGDREDEIRTGKLILMMEGDSPGVSLVAGPEESLVIQSPDGSEILQLGGSPLRRVGER